MTVDIDDDTSGKCIYKAGKHVLYVTKTLDGQVVEVYNLAKSNSDMVEKRQRGHVNWCLKDQYSECIRSTSSGDVNLNY